MPKFISYNDGLYGVLDGEKKNTCFYYTETLEESADLFSLRILPIKTNIIKLEKWKIIFVDNNLIYKECLLAFEAYKKTINNAL